MYAVINTGGKQYRVEPGQVLRVEKLDGEVGDQIELKPVLMVGGEGEIKVGKPHLEGAVSVTITGQGFSKKVVVFKKKRRKAYKVKRGHRQQYTEVRIEAIEA